MIQKSILSILILILMGFTDPTPLDQEKDPSALLLRDFSTSWTGSLGFDILGTTKLKVRTTVYIRWTKKSQELEK